jgi:hypothetical protein
MTTAGTVVRSRVEESMATLPEVLRVKESVAAGGTCK